MKMKNIAIAALAAPAIVLGTASAASAAPGDLDRIQETSGTIDVQTEQEAAWEALVFAGLGTVYVIGTVVVGT